jgi:hypothetical protein
MEKHQFTSAELLTIVRRGLFAIDDLYGSGQQLWFNLVKRDIRKHIDIEDDPMLYALINEVDENLEINPEHAIRALNKLLMFVSTIATTD